MFIDTIIKKAINDIKTIILLDSTNITVLKATEKLTREKIANIILIGDKEKIKNIANENNIDIELAQIINPNKYRDRETLAQKLYEIIKQRGITLKKVNNLILDEIYFAMMLLKLNKADGLICASNSSISDILKLGQKIIKTREDIKTVSSFTMVELEDFEYGNIYLFSDCGLNDNPNSNELAEIAISSAITYQQLTEQLAKIGMLSYSTYRSIKSDSTKKIVDATTLAKLKNPKLMIDGELQIDVAIIPEIADNKAPNSKVAGICNTLIFPNADAGNIGYKLVKIFSNSKVYGPLYQGLNKPVNFLSDNYTVDDIINIVAITSIQTC